METQETYAQTGAIFQVARSFRREQSFDGTAQSFTLVKSFGGIVRSFTGFPSQLLL